MTAKPTLRMIVSNTAFGASLAAGMMLGGGASAQTATSPQAQAEPEASQAVRLPGISVVGDRPENTLRGETGLGRLSGPIQSIPQTIQVVPREVLQQQNVTTLEQALRNVPGITSSVGEGNGGVNGDQIRIRGFNAQNDLYVDGLRDFGTFRRDAFTFEEVQALLGPSGQTFGAGSAGGTVNVVSRTARLGNSFNADATAGMGPFFRSTVDGNYQISDTAAVRLNLMGQTSRLAGRDMPWGERWGIAPSIAFGLGTDTTFTLEYLHYQYDEPTDTGVPVLTRPGATVGRPITEYGLDRRTWLGTPNDRDKTTVDRLTARLQHRATDWLTIYNDTRAGIQDRSFSYSIIGCTADCATGFFNRTGTPGYTYSGAGSPYDSSTWGVQNVTTAVARFNTGSLRHEATVGVDGWYEDFERTGYSYGADRSAFRGNFFEPDNDTSYSYTRSTAANATRRAQTTAVGVFASERLWLTPQLSVLGGVRWNRFQTDYQAFGPGVSPTELNADNSFVDPRGAVIWEPTRDYTFYFSYAQSSFAPGSNFATQPGQANVNNTQLEPERNDIYEIGARGAFLGGRLGLSAAAYQITKNNATETDALTGATFTSGDRQEVRGIDIGATGSITPAWTLNARYSYTDSETTRSTTPANVGKPIQLVPEQSAALWTAYEFNQGQKLNLTVGGGVTWASRIFLNAANSQEVPESFSLDAFVSHRLNQNLLLRVNGYNLTDHRNYTHVSSGRAALGTGRAVTMTLSTNF
ncbi:TonB-dependent siderophore receptor [Roseomonas frigidaquae]|uniref:TonB-dependent siderophore receptor n=1 Tax=Falsiroseomonas frigidaquae TaxID=487318 RepID=A0ABX1ESP1_9PROT|nr:TonB-dependent siderophore receptor [Falsiroseomonas frigidaquae]NKE43158.1 TonB-dependent siderophore receptor [Falsiroseomonas frigidaquae]